VIRNQIIIINTNHKAHEQPKLTWRERQDYPW